MKNTDNLPIIAFETQQGPVSRKLLHTCKVCLNYFLTATLRFIAAYVILGQPWHREGRYPTSTT